MMIGVSRNRSPEETGVGAGDDSYSTEYSIGYEYTGPPVSFEIPRIAPVDVRRIPMAKAASRTHLTDSYMPVAHPIGSKGTKLKKPCVQAASASQVLPLGSRSSNFVGLDGDQSDNSKNPKSSNSNEVEEEHVVEAKRSFVTFQDSASNDSFSSSSYQDEPKMSAERLVIHEDERKGMCRKCGKKSRFARREPCLVCGAEYCSNCVIRAMGSMQEGRKCITCIGSPIDESKRRLLGKCSRILRKLLPHEVINQIMEVERTCQANRPSPDCIIVNDKPLSLQEYNILLRCPNPPKKLKPGRYWYDKGCGFWGKEGEKPCQIISCLLEVGGPLKENASNGDAKVIINNREITKPELRMLKAAGIHCEGNPRFWVAEDGSCRLEGMNNTVGYLWGKKKMKLYCTILSLPYLSDGKKPVRSVSGDSDVKGDTQEQVLPYKLLLLGDDQSGTSTMFKQARVLYDFPFTDNEKQDLKAIIQRNVYKYIALLLEERVLLETEHEQSANDPGPSGSKTPTSSTENHNEVDEKKAHSFSPRLEAFSSDLTEMMSSGSLEIIFPAATREYAPLVEELWNNKSFQEIYQRRNEIKMLPEVASYFLEKAIEISRVDYEPSVEDIMHAEGISSSNGVAMVPFSFPSEEVMEHHQNDLSVSYQLIRVNASNLGQKSKFLQFFEGVNLVIFCASLTSYGEYYEDENRVLKNQMMKTKKLFETIVTHPVLSEANFLLILTKYDLLKKKLKQVPLQECDWFQDFCPATSLHPDNINGTNTSLEQKAFHYIAVKFKRLFNSFTDRKLFVSWVNALDSDNVDNSIRLCHEILKWEEKTHLISTNEWSETIEQSQSTSS